MADSTTTAAISVSVLTFAAIEAGAPLAIGFIFAGLFGALVGHVRWTLERERQNPNVPELPMRQHVCMLLRAIIMAEFVSLVLLLIWLDQVWPWTWGLIVGAVSSVFAADAIELMWNIVRTRALGYAEKK